MKRGIAYLLICLLGTSLFPPSMYAQKNKHGEKEDYGVEPGADFIIGTGIYFGNKKTAGYYSGIPTNENNLNYIFENPSWNKQIVELITNSNHNISMYDTTLGVGEYPQKMRYKPVMSITLGASYRFDKHWRISIYYTFARLVAKDFFLVTFEGVPGNMRNNYESYSIIGKENRSLFDLTGSYTFHVNKIVKPFIELGLQFNFARVKSLDAIIEDRPFNLLDIYGGNTYVQGADMQKIDQKYGGPGFALTGTTGIKLAFSRAVSIDPCFYISFGKIGLKGYTDFHFNYGIFVRLVMSDAMFGK